MPTVLILPAYNEGRTLRDLVIAVLQLPAGIDQLIVVDDGSTDDSVSGLPVDPRLRVIRHAHNEGKARALIDGMHLALQLGAQRIVTMDGDGQHRPQDIERLRVAADEHPRSIIIGARLADRDRIPSARYRANRFANFWIAWASGYPVIDSQSGFRLYPAEALRTVLSQLARRYPLHASSRRKGFVFESEVLIVAGQRRVDTVAVRIPALYGTARASHFRPVADITQIVLMVAAHLLRRGLHPRGLWRSLMQPARKFAHKARLLPHQEEHP